jgi:hypothetical protein
MRIEEPVRSIESKSFVLLLTAIQFRRGLNLRES